MNAVIQQALPLVVFGILICLPMFAIPFVHYVNVRRTIAIQNERRATPNPVLQVLQEAASAKGLQIRTADFEPTPPQPKLQGNIVATLSMVLLLIMLF